MFIDTKFPHVNIITNLLLVDLAQARIILRNALDDNLKAEAIVTVNRFRTTLDNIAYRAKDPNVEPDIQESLAAIDFAEARNSFNIMLLRHKFLSLDGINFLITLTDEHKKKHTVKTVTPRIVAQNLKRAVRDFTIVHIDVTLFEKNANRINGVSAESLFRFGCSENYLRSMLDSNPQQFIDIALAADDAEMILAFARRPPQESSQRHYYRCEPVKAGWPI